MSPELYCYDDFSTCLIGKKIDGQNFSPVKSDEIFEIFSHRRDIFTRISDKKKQRSYFEFIFSLSLIS